MFSHVSVYVDMSQQIRFIQKLVSVHRAPHLFKLKNLKTYFLTFEGVANAGDDVYFYLDKGEVLGVVGESGCGKNVTTQSIMRLFPSGREPLSALSLIPQTQD